MSVVCWTFVSRNAHISGRISLSLMVNAWVHVNQKSDQLANSKETFGFTTSSKKPKKKQPKNVPIFSFLNILMEKVTLFNTQFQMDLYVFVVLLLLLRFVFAWNKVNYLFALMDASALVMLYSILFFCLTTYVSNSFEMPLNMANIGQKHLNSVLF